MTPDGYVTPECQIMTACLIMKVRLAMMMAQLHKEQETSFLQYMSHFK